MSKFLDKHADKSLNFEGFLNGLQDWDHSVKDKGKKLKPQVSQKGKSDHSSMDYDPLSQMSSSFLTEESTVDAASEKDLGNEYFKQKKFNEAIDCYCRSIALSPTAVAYANRAMAYLKIKRFQEAEEDCTEALNLDDRYIKAYSRRATARKELGKLRDSLEDVEFALRLEPQDEDLKKQRAQVKSLLEKAILAKAASSSTTIRPSQGVKEVDSKVGVQHKDKRTPSVPAGSKKTGVDVLSDNQVSVKQTFVSGDTVAKNKTSDAKQQINGLQKASPNSLPVKHTKAGKELDISVHELAARAASRSRVEAAKNIVAPTSAYQFEVSWKGFSGDRYLQSRLLKVTPPDALPEIFKNALIAPLLVDIVNCLSTIFTEEMELVVKYLENFTRVPRFGMIIMCLPSSDKADLHRVWNEVFLGKATPIEFAETLGELYPKYCPR
ncbi:hypothetical protein RND81_04G226300 [Saponaria officinalis]|uniref:RNA-polymerase II-associated protein 3-like C-terminal domain-containing protein n=1 Tax=Saponaria officinalis TaxID=3572 RepID=A0AAW1LPT2_SAPOF